MMPEGLAHQYLTSIGINPGALEKVSLPTLLFAAQHDMVKMVVPNVAAAELDELRHQRDELKLIASENYADPAVLTVMGSWLSDKYAEGSIGHRFYAGCERIDIIEREATERGARLFGADHAYVQPHSGSDANLVAFWAVLTERVQGPYLERAGVNTVQELSDTQWEELRGELNGQVLMSMDLESGGHLTHGFRHNISGKLFRHASYKVDSVTGLLDYAELRRRALETRPLILLAGYSSYPRRLNFAKFAEIAAEAGSVLMVDMAHFAGLVAGGALAGDYDPVPFADIVSSTTHKTLRGPRGGFVLAKDWLADAVDRGCPLVLGGPLPHVMAAKAVAFQLALEPAFAQYSHRVVENAAALADGLSRLGLSLVSGGTDNHIVLVDLSRTGLTGRQAEGALTACGITVNRNVVPGEAAGAWYTSGIRLGTAAVTTRGLGAAEMGEIARLIHKVIDATKPAPSRNGTSLALFDLPDSVREGVRGAVLELLAPHPLYDDIALG